MIPKLVNYVEGILHPFYQGDEISQKLGQLLNPPDIKARSAEFIISKY